MIMGFFFFVKYMNQETVLLFYKPVTNVSNVLGIQLSYNKLQGHYKMEVKEASQEDVMEALL